MTRWPLLGVECFFDEVEQRQTVRRYQIRRNHTETLRDRAHACLTLRGHLAALRPVGHALHAPVHFVDRHFLRDRVDGPGIAERVGEEDVTVTVELVGCRAPQSHTGGNGIFREFVHVLDPHRH